MQAQCPYCQTIFRITAAHLNVAQGHVRCGQCQNVFDATKYLVREAQPAPPSVTLPNQESVLSNRMEDSEFFQEEEDIEEHSRNFWKLFFWTLTAFLLAGILGMQTVWFLKRDLILQDIRLRPWLERFCYTFLCHLPDTRDVERFVVQDSLVSVYPDVSNDVIEVELTFSNMAFFPQPYPEVQITFKNNNETPLAQRRFRPEEYLPLSSGKLMRSGTSVHFKLKLKDTLNMIDNGKLVVGYNFDFL